MLDRLATPCLRSPSDACVAFPAKKIPGSVTLSQYGVSAGSRSFATVASPWSRQVRSGAESRSRR